MKTKKLINNIIFLGRKWGAIKAIQYILDKNIKIKILVIDKQYFNEELKEIVKKNHISVLFDDRKLYQLIKQGDKITQEIDLVISYLYWKKIRFPIIKLAKRGCINFHPAPLPDYKGRGGYNTAILDKRSDFGVSVHFIDSEELDSGPIIKVIKFPIDSDNETAYSLGKITQPKLYELFKSTLNLFQDKVKIKTTRNSGGLYFNKKQIESLKVIDLKKDNLDLIERKIRAFFYPPYSGAKLVIKGKEFTLINDKILRYLSDVDEISNF